MAAAPARVGAVVVVFHPNMEHLQELVRHLAERVSVVVLVNNGTRPIKRAGILPFGPLDNVGVIDLGGNLGIAAALNRGVDYLHERNCSHAWSFDQDSMPGPNALPSLLAVWSSAPMAASIAAAAPAIHAHNKGRALPFLVVTEQDRVQVKNAAQSQEVAVAITSGLLVRIDVWQLLGGALEPLFIDHVDTEWCLRLRSAGWRVLAVPQACIEHQLGEPGPRLAWWFGPRVTVRPPLRTYYMLRNGWLLGRMPFAPAGWHRYQRWQAARIIAVALLHGPQRRGQWRAILRAIRHACRSYEWIR